MATTKEIDLGQINVASVRRMKVTIKKDGVAWTGIDSVDLVFEDPDRETQFTRTMLLETPDAGVWYYDLTTTDILDTGRWTINVRVTDGAIVTRYAYEIGFDAMDNP